MNQRTKLLGAVGILLAIVIVVVVSLRGCQPVQSTDYKIGVVLALTGRGATYGQRSLNGMQLAVDDLNATEPFRSRPIKLVVEDSQSGAPQALSAFRKLIDVDHVPVVVGLVLSDEVLSSAPVANERKVVLLTTAAGSNKIKDAGDYVFRNRESGELAADKIATACIQRFGVKEAAIVHSNSANGVSYRDDFRKAFERLGGTISLTVGYDEGKTDYRAQIEQLRAKSPKAVYIAGLDQELGLILKQSKEVGFNAQFFGSPGAISSKLLEIAGSSAEGLVSASSPFDVSSNDPRTIAFVNAYKTRFNDLPDFIAGNSYDAIQMIAVLFKNGATTSEQIKAGLYATKDYPGVGGQTTFDANGEVSKPISLVQVQNARFVRLGD